MCGIYCCLKCNADNRSSREDIVLPKLRDYLKHRGPDCFSEYAIDVGCKWSVSFAGSVLWMQGFQLTMQPLIDDEYNYLLWNGDVFNGSMVNQETLSDTVKISQLFSKGNGTEIPVILSSIQGPYAFIYLDVKRQHLYFGRDRLGRHSLLWSSNSEEGFVLTSVGKRNVLDFKEVPTVGIFMVDMNSSDLGHIILYPWSDISAETLLNIDQECVLKVEVSSQSVQSPIILDRNNREKPFDSKHPLNQHDTEGVIGVHQIRDFMEKLQSDSDIKKSVKKLIYLLRNAVRVRVQTHPGICKECLECTKHMNVKTRAHKLTSECSDTKYQQEFLHCFKDDPYEAQPSETSLTDIEPRSSHAKACMCSEKELIMSHGHSTCLKHTDVEECLQSEPTTYSKEMWTTKNPKLCHHSKVGILFSGGLDSTILAALAHEFIPLGEPIDLLNVAFERERKEGNQNRKAAREKKHVRSSEEKEVTYLVPDRITGKNALDDLKRLYPNRQWNFVQMLLKKN
ncbi:hypothetical protein B7P43_G16500 [Cryptotermes secundus]|uniref:Glutamine amidotransferase type-2 domain-containing protein n=1 Tax=Cryptotermes secundus TaxID=105785 RepID=A0A2J7QWM9_9NEOP|nr:hypothetical protein B7P43_G16500 [Cryptotermes secundus]PNF32989.1 hypothetical protein B7P43_G16500 [Cryptotermes secundus]